MSALNANLAEVVSAGLRAIPKSLPPVLFYDAVGSGLFEQICQCPEYYLTRTERRILTQHATVIATALPHELTLIELGCGSAEKTEILLRALLAAEHRLRYVACDVSEPALARTVSRLRANHHDLDVIGVPGDFAAAFQAAPRLLRGTCVWAFLGSSIGNFAPAAATAFLGRVRAAAAGHLLLGADMVKDHRVLNAAYDDAAGVTAAFNRNLLHRINRQWDADFVPEQFAHCAFYNPQQQRIEMHLVSEREQMVHLRGLDLTVSFARGETLHTEDSHKYTTDDLQRMAAAAGFTPQQSFTDADRWFTVALWAASAPGPLGARPTERRPESAR